MVGGVDGRWWEELMEGGGRSLNLLEEVGIELEDALHAVQRLGPQ